jgi:phage baseplate assembly protein W
MVTLNKLSREFVDLDFSFEKHPITKNVSIKKNINAVKQAIIHLLKIKSGDKPFHPEIKSPIYDFLFENASNISKIILESEIQKYLNVYEPRINILSVNVSYPDQNTIVCEISGRLVNTTEPFDVKILVDRLR